MLKKQAIDKYLKCREELNKAGDELEQAFIGYKEILKNSDFKGAKEFLRTMPESAEKVLFFRHIIMLEKENKGK